MHYILHHDLDKVCVIRAHFTTNQDTSSIRQLVRINADDGEVLPTLDSQRKLVAV